MKKLPDIQFAAKSAEQIELSITTRFEELRQQKLQRGDPRRMFIQAFVPILLQQRSLIDFSAKQNMIGFAEGGYLDWIGNDRGVPRNEATYSVTTMEFNLSVIQKEDKIIKKGTRVTAGDNIFFESKENIHIPKGSLQAIIPVVCMQEGMKGNGYLPGQINKLVDPIPYIESVSNVTTSEGGSDRENDKDYEERIRTSPESFSVAGPEEAYKFWAKTAHPLVHDVLARKVNPGEVEIRPLLEEGRIPGQEILNIVFKACNDRKVRPLTDKVSVVAPEVVQYDINLTYYISTQSAERTLAIQEAVQREIQEYVTWQKSKLGRDIDATELIYRIKSAGAKRVVVVAPVGYTQVEKFQVAVERNVNVIYGGLEDD